jgi:hypothetical protein
MLILHEDAQYLLVSRSVLNLVRRRRRRRKIVKSSSKTGDRTKYVIKIG